jgi:hypothetical protein
VSLSRTDLTLSASTITVNSSTASFSATASTDATAEGYVTFQAILRKDSQTGIEVGRSNAIGLIDSSIPIPTYSIEPSLSAINEGGSVTFNVATTNVNPGTTLYWTTSRTDLTPNNGSFVVSSGSNSFAVTANTDSFTEGPTSFTASLRAGSTSGGILVTSSAVGINDTSLDPINYSIGLRVDVYRDVGTAEGSFIKGYQRGGTKGGFIRVLLKRDSVLQYGSDGKCNVTVSFANNSMTGETNWNTTLRITQNQLLNDVPNTITGIVPATDAGYYDITGVLPRPSTFGWQETRGCIPAGSTTTVTLRDTLAGTTKSGSVGTHSNGLTGQAYPKYF